MSSRMPFGCTFDLANHALLRTILHNCVPQNSRPAIGCFRTWIEGKTLSFVSLMLLPNPEVRGKAVRHTHAVTFDLAIKCAPRRLLARWSMTISTTSAGEHASLSMGPGTLASVPKHAVGAGQVFTRLLATNPQVMSRMLAIVHRVISTFLIKRAGMTVKSGAQSGAVTLIQRFGRIIVKLKFQGDDVLC